MLKVFPHIEETLQILHVKGIQLGLVTSKTKEEMKKMSLIDLI